MPIDDWNELKEIPGVNELSQESFAVPDWQITLGKKELQLVSNGTAELMDWDTAKKQCIL